MYVPTHGNRLSSRRHLRLPFFFLATGAMLAIQALCLESRIPAVKPEFFKESVVELKVTPKWRYGYIQLWHGSVLVKARNREPETLQDGFQAEPIPTGWPDREMAAIMRRELEALPGKAAQEAGLYSGLLWYIFFGWGRLERVFIARGRTRGRLLTARVSGWVILWLIAGMPLLLWGYGTPVFTNCVGPGALSASGISLGQAPGYSSTVSYKLMIGALAPFFLILLAAITPASLWFPNLTEGQFLWLGGLLFFIMVGLARTLLQAGFRRGTRGRHIY